MHEICTKYLHYLCSNRRWMWKRKWRRNAAFVYIEATFYSVLLRTADEEVPCVQCFVFEEGLIALPE
jgi:hypothetical protein